MMWCCGGLIVNGDVVYGVWCCGVLIMNDDVVCDAVVF